MTLLHDRHIINVVMSREQGGKAIITVLTNKTTQKSVFGHTLSGKEPRNFKRAHFL